MHEFDAVLEKGVILQKNEDALYPSVLDPNNATNKKKIKMKQIMT